MTIKRYHVSDFRQPYVPDQDRQELPNSQSSILNIDYPYLTSLGVILDFHSGSTLQLASENLKGQNELMKGKALGPTPIPSNGNCKERPGADNLLQHSSWHTKLIVSRCHDENTIHVC